MRLPSRRTREPGTLVHVGRFDLAEFAVVLEPDEPLRIARRAIYTGTCALGDALAANAPPEKSIGFAWPDAIRVDGGLVGGVRLAWPAGAEEDEPPAWLVFGAMIRIVAMGEGEAGLRPLAAALEDEGFSDLDGGWSKASPVISWPPSTHARRRDSVKWRRAISRVSRREASSPEQPNRQKRRMPRDTTSTKTEICWCGMRIRASNDVP